MCGIGGYFGNGNKSLLNKMSLAIEHRGPDDKGVFTDKNIGLLNRRLAILDIKGGHQPMYSKDKNLCIVHNGEIYNYEEIRDQLVEKHVFKTNTDTEVILEAYRRWGEKCVKKFNGMFSFAIYDKKKDKLFIARDRLGIKPLYYYYNKKNLIFASEIKALFESNNVPREANDKIIYGYLLYNLHDHTEDTFKGIKRLMPGHHMTITKSGMKIKKYWKLNIKEKPSKKYAKDVKDLLKKSIIYRLISDVPVGSCLSGGIDSTSIVSLINKEVKNKQSIGRFQKTFSAVYKNNKIDESKFINTVIKQTKVEKNFVYPNSKNFWKDIEKIVYYQDEPFIGPSIYAQWEVMKKAREKVKVILDGQGGDELFGGYTPYYPIYILDLIKKGKLARAAKEAIYGAEFNIPLIKKFSKIKENQKNMQKMLNENFVKDFNKKTKSKWSVKDLNTLLHLETTRQSLPKLLRYEDRNSMAFSIEARVPFLDHNLVEYAFTIPAKEKIKSGWTKHVLRKAMKDTIPKSIVRRKDKIGFDVPEAKWLKERKKEVKKLFKSEKFKKIKYFDHNRILDDFDNFCKGKIDESYARMFWRIIILTIWIDVFL